MHELDMTTVSSKGQVVLPRSIRRKLRLEAGEKLIVISGNDTVVLKKIEKPVLERFRDLLAESRAAAKKAELTKADIKEAIQRVRRSAV